MPGTESSHLSGKEKPCDIFCAIDRATDFHRLLSLKVELRSDVYDDNELISGDCLDVMLPVALMLLVEVEHACVVELNVCHTDVDSAFVDHGDLKATVEVYDERFVVVAAVVVVVCVWNDCDWDGDGGVWLTDSQAASVLLKDLKVNPEDHNAPRWHNTFVKPESHSRVAVLYPAGESEDRSNSSSGSNESIAA